MMDIVLAALIGIAAFLALPKPQAKRLPVWIPVKAERKTRGLEVSGLGQMPTPPPIEAVKYEATGSNPLRN